MLPLRIGAPGTGNLRLLCIGAHADDIEIGCGGTVLGMVKEGRVAHATWVVLSGAGSPREVEARKGAGRFLRGVKERDVRVEGFRDGYFPVQREGLKDYFETLKAVRPDLVLTHQLEEHHQDHRLVAELTWNTFRDHLVLEYEVPKYDGLLGRPNIYVPIPAAHRRRKVRALVSVFASQRDKRWFSPETFEGLMRLRGVECASATGYAEAFVGRKVSLGVG